jgi:hypothetical protein
MRPPANLQRRLKKLETVLLDQVGLVPHSQKWIEYWDRQFYLYMSGQDRNAIRQSTVEEYRAVMKYAEESSVSLVASVLPLCEAV